MIPQLKRFDMHDYTSLDGKSAFIYVNIGEEPKPWLMYIESSHPSFQPPPPVFITEEEMLESVDEVKRYRLYSRYHTYSMEVAPDDLIWFTIEVIHHPFYFYYLEPTDEDISPWERIKRVTILEDKITDICNLDIHACDILDSPDFVSSERFDLLFGKKVSFREYLGDRGVCYMPGTANLFEKLDNDPELLRFLDMVICRGWRVLSKDGGK